QRIQKTTTKRDSLQESLFKEHSQQLNNKAVSLCPEFPSGQKAPKYRTPLGDQYDALLPTHPTDPTFWLDIPALKERCYQINGIPIIVLAEGGFKAIALCSYDIPSFSILGVEMGLTPSKDDPQGKRYVVSEIERFAKYGFGFMMGFDADSYTKTPVKQGLIKLARKIQQFDVPVYNFPRWDECLGKGLDDYIQNNGIEAFHQNLLSQAVSFDTWYKEHGQDAFDKKPPKADILGAEIAEKYRDTWIFCDQLKTWLAYSLETEGIWTVVSPEYLEAEVHTILKARNIKGYSTNAYIKNIVGALKRELYLRKWDELSSTDWLPFQNGVLELATGKLHDHSPGFRFTWRLPRDYVVVERGWRAIDTWLNEATKGNQEYKELLLCFAAGVLRGRSDLQKFMHLIGGGGSGKSTFTNLITALIGEENTVTIDLSDLEDKHERARIFGKRLVVLPDQDKAPKKLSSFKRLTGQDRLSGRRLFENGFEHIFSGMAIVTSNFPIFHTNVGSWLHRRQIMIPFDYQCPKHKKRDLMKDFEPELGALTSYLLSIPSERIEAVLNGLGSSNLNSTVWESQMRSDGLAAWLNDWVVPDSMASVRIGSNSKEWMSEEDYDASRSTLYGSYALYCRQTNRSAKSPQNFSAELLELGTSIVGWSMEKGRVTMCGKTVRVIKGIKLRREDDNLPTVEETLEVDKSADKVTDGGNDKGTDNISETVEIQAEKGIQENINNESPPSVEKIEKKSHEINWQSYPYNSGDRFTLENRANKVKERVLGCGTSNELIGLHADGKVSEPEVNWIKANYLSESELAQLVTIEGTKQGNLFSQQQESDVIEWDQIKSEIDSHMKRLGWSKKQGKQYLIKRYGKTSRIHLTDAELIEFNNFLRKQVDKLC
ncbi:MAG: DUF3854 domain-containing protein, partial [Xenococcaceae cyanobacterium MO_207.B15]|nr:DUF3854 domain-containing protein [Xenococcaceae cyanobacterium MO_207.B15]